jgi:hypothetical protein
MAEDFLIKIISGNRVIRRVRAFAISVIIGITKINLSGSRVQLINARSDMPEQDRQRHGKRHYLIRAIPYQDPRQEAERLKAAQVKIIPRF